MYGIRNKCYLHTVYASSIHKNILHVVFFLSNRDRSIENLITNITLVIETLFKPERKSCVCNSICIRYTKFYTDLEACAYQEIPLDLLHTQNEMSFLLQTIRFLKLKNASSSSLDENL